MKVTIFKAAIFLLFYDYLYPRPECSQLWFSCISHSPFSRVRLAAWAQLQQEYLQQGSWKGNEPGVFSPEGWENPLYQPVLCLKRWGTHCVCIKIGVQFLETEPWWSGTLRRWWFGFPSPSRSRSYCTQTQLCLGLWDDEVIRLCIQTHWFCIWCSSFNKSTLSWVSGSCMTMGQITDSERIRLFLRKWLVRCSLWDVRSWEGHKPQQGPHWQRLWQFSSNAT